VDTEVVVDSSALIEILVRPKPDRALRRRILTSENHAPEVVDAEVLSVLRRMVAAGRLAAAQATLAVENLAAAPLARSPHRPLLARAWQLRDSVFSHDALYVALAEQLHVPLVTCDGRLARSHGHGARIELYRRS
jgi:predicted nucleic acid-binding protein